MTDDFRGPSYNIMTFIKVAVNQTAPAMQWLEHTGPNLTCFIPLKYATENTYGFSIICYTCILLGHGYYMNL